jgi:hypothetical protein
MDWRICLSYFNVNGSDQADINTALEELKAAARAFGFRRSACEQS